MAAQPPTRYQRLPCRGHGSVLPRWGLVLTGLLLGPVALLFRGTLQELWDGGDHLLVVENTGYTERYRRFRYSDIQALQQWRTLDYPIAAALIAFALIPPSVFAIMNWGTPSMTFPAVLTGLLAILLAWHLGRGPTCRTRLRSAVHWIELPALGRTRSFHRVMPLLRARITTAQGSLEADRLLALAREARSDASPGSSMQHAVADRVAGATTFVPSPVTPLRNLRAHWGVALLCLLDPVMTALSFRWDNALTTGISVLLMLGAVIMSILALVAQNRRIAPRSLRALPWLALGTIAFVLFAGSAASLGTVFKMSAAGLDDFDWRAVPLIVAMAVVTSLANLVIGVVGIRALISLRASAGVEGKPPETQEPGSTPGAP